MRGTKNEPVYYDVITENVPHNGKRTLLLKKKKEPV